MAFALFDESGALSRTAMRRQIEAMLHHKVHGVAILGLASEVHKLSTQERLTLMQWVIEDVGGVVPVAVTIAENSIRGQVDFVREAGRLGAGWVILQPPPSKGVPELELIRFFGAVAEKSPVPVGIQNAPEYLGYGLSNAGLKTLNKQHPNVLIAKLEAPAIALRRLIEEVDGAIDVFNGRAGIELIDGMRGGAVGFIPGGESFDILTRIFNDFAAGTPERQQAAEKAYAEILPLLVALMESIDTFLVYGKAVLGQRLGISETASRAPASSATPFGIELVLRYAARCGKL
jgi:4-hydroxy-tetrahydrodipicolinate synthase